VKQRAEIVGGGLAELSAEARLIGAGKAGLDLLEQIVWRLFGFLAFQRMRVVRGASCGAHRSEALEERGALHDDGEGRRKGARAQQPGCLR